MFISFSRHKRSLKAGNKVKNKYEEIESVMKHVSASVQVVQFSKESNYSMV